MRDGPDRTLVVNFSRAALPPKVVANGSSTEPPSPLNMTKPQAYDKFFYVLAKSERGWFKLYSARVSNILSLCYYLCPQFPPCETDVRLVGDSGGSVVTSQAFLAASSPLCWR